MADSLDDRLRDLARDTEPLIVLAGPADVRRRGERRGARRRTGAVAVVAAAALALGSWVVVPRLGSGAQTPAVSGSPSPDALPTRELTDELLPPSALPWASYWQWQSVAYDISAKIPLMKCDPSLYDPAAATVRSYRGKQSSSARYAIRTLRDGVQAAAEVHRIGDQLGACGLMTSYNAGSEGAEVKTVLRGYGVSKLNGQVSEVWLVSQGRFVATLQVITPTGAVGRPEYPDLTPVTCMTGSLDRLAPSSVPWPTSSASAPPPAGTATPPPPGPTGSGAGSGAPASQGWITPDGLLDQKFPPTYDLPTSSDRC